MQPEVRPRPRSVRKYNYTDCIIRRRTAVPHASGGCGMNLVMMLGSVRSRAAENRNGPDGPELGGRDPSRSIPRDPPFIEDNAT